MNGYVFAQDVTLRTDLGIGSVPFGVVVDAGEKVLARGLVNGISHVESLLEAAVGSPAAFARGGGSSAVASVSADARAQGN